MTGKEMAVAGIIGLLVNEVTDICPWVAVRLVRWAARLRYPHAPKRAATRGEELAALINDRPGKLLKLFTALGFALHALVITGLRSAPRGARRLGASAIRFAADHRVDARTVAVAITLGAGAMGAALGGIVAAGEGPIVGVIVSGVMAVTAGTAVAEVVDRREASVAARAVGRVVLMGGVGAIVGTVGVAVGGAVGVAVSGAVGVVMGVAVGVAAGVAVGVAVDMAADQLAWRLTRRSRWFTYRR